MYKKRIIMEIAIAGCLFATISILNIGNCYAFTSDDRLVATYYFYWYDVHSGCHFIDPDGSDALTDHPPDEFLDTYSYADVSWHKRELQDMMEAKIDIVLPVYWGDYTNKFWSIAGLTKLVEAQNELLSEGKNPPKIGMFYDTTALLIQNNDIPPDLTTDEGKILFYSMIKDFFDQIPSSLWAEIDGRPIMWLYSAGFVSAYDQSTFDFVIQQFQTDFGGKTLYIVREISWDVQTDNFYQFGSTLNGARLLGVSSVGPGYDDSAVYGRTPSYQDRLGGQFYIDNWKQAIAAGRNIVVVETWNELHEATEICHSKEYGRQYINLTRKFAEEFKEGFDYADASEVFINLGSGNTEQGLLQKARTQPDGQTEVAVQNRIEGVQPDLNSTPIPSHYVYFDVNDRFIHAQETEVWIAIEYFDDQEGFFVEYDSADASLPDIEQRYKDTEIVWLNGTEEWKIYIFHLSDAFFANRQNNFSDFRLSICCEKIQTFNRVWVSKTDPREMLSKIFPPSQILPQSLRWTTDSIVGIDFEEPNYIAGITEEPCADGETFPDMKADVECRRVPIRSSAGYGNYIYLNVNDSIVFNDGPTELWIAVEYFDESIGNLTLEYDTVGDRVPEDAFKLAEIVPFTDTKEWKIHIYHIPDAEFKNQANGADFRFSLGGMELYINRVWVVGHEPTLSELENFMLEERGQLADVSGNGTISAYDAALILQYVVGLIDEFPAESLLSPNTPQLQNYVVRAPFLRVHSGQRVRIPIIINDATGLRTGCVRLTYAPNILRPIEVTPGPLLAGFYWDYRISNGEARVAFAGVKLPQSGGNLFYVEFESLLAAEGSVSPLTIEHLQLNEAEQITVMNGSVEILPGQTVLLPNFPNPFNPETWIPYQLAEDVNVTTRIYDVTGQLVRTLELGQKLAGFYLSKEKAAYWDGRNELGEKISSGVYFYTIKAGNFIATRKMILMK